MEFARIRRVIENTLWVIGLLGMVFISSIARAVPVDFRVSGNLSTGSDQANYVLTIGDCSALASAQIQVGSVQGLLTATDFTPVILNSNACQTIIQSEGVGRFSPQVTLNFIDGSAPQIHSESFDVEATLPEITFDNVSISLLDNKQYLIVNFTAMDDVDISYINFSVAGIRASELREFGGIIAKARELAFATTTDGFRVYPNDDAQQAFSVPIEITQPLSAEAIASDGVVLIDATVVDASGNARSISQVALTGSDVKEEVNGWNVSPQQITFNNLLESISIIPSLDFQFRGLTPIVGAGSGVTYTSSHPELVAVTADGLVFPLQETNSETVTITVSYVGLSDQIIPVTSDFTKIVTGLQVQGLNNDGAFVLDKLNTVFEPPIVHILFDDASTSPLSEQVELSYSLSGSSSGVLTLSVDGRLSSQAVINNNGAAQLTIGLVTNPQISTDIPIVAVDALPVIVASIERSVVAGTVLPLRAKVTDDVAVTSVTFTMDGIPVGRKTSPPYELDVAIADSLAGSTLAFQIVAVDSLGQTAVSAEYSVKVNPLGNTFVPELIIEQPVEMQQIVEETPFSFQLVRD